MKILFGLGDALTNLTATLKDPYVLWGMALAVIGIAISFLAHRITQTAKKIDMVSKNDGLFITLRAVGLLLIVAAVILVVVFRYI